MVAGFGLANPTLHALISRRAGPETQGATLGVAQSASSLARIMAPAGSGVVFAAWGRDWLYFIGAILLIGAGMATWSLVRASARRPQ